MREQQETNHLMADADVTAAVAAWQVQLGQARARRTLNAYLLDLSTFLQYLSARLQRPAALSDLALLGTDDFQDYCAHLAGQGRLPASIARALSALRNLFQFLAEAGFIHNSAVKRLASPKVPRRPRLLAKEHAQKAVTVIADLSDTPWIAKRDEALFALLYGSGLRLGEALALTRAQAPQGQTLVINGSGDKQRVVPVLPFVPALIADYLSACPYALTDEHPLFVGAYGGRLNPGVVQRQLRRLRGLLGLPKQATPQALRQSFAAQLHAAGNDWRTIQQLLGHAHLATTRRYADRDD